MALVQVFKVGTKEVHSGVAKSAKPCPQGTEKSLTNGCKLLYLAT